MITCDCTIFAKAKFIQWTWPLMYREDKFVIMFGGLHVEMALWNIIGDYLTGSGWTAVLVEAGVATSGTAESFLTASYHLRTHHAHQVTNAALTALQNQANLVVERSWALPPFHAFTGCDTTSSFFGMSKKSAWQAWNAYPEATKAFIYFAQHPYEPISLSSEHYLILKRFTVVLYYKSSCLAAVNEARRELFCKKNKSLENIPPTHDALFQHTKRAIIQSNI